MQCGSRVYFYNDDGERIFGRGPKQLLQYVEETGSLRSAAIRMNMSYGKALQIIKRLETALGITVLERSIGGTAGGGSRLTEEAKELLRRFEVLEHQVEVYTKRKYQLAFPMDRAEDAD